MGFEGEEGLEGAGFVADLEVEGGELVEVGRTAFAVVMPNLLPTRRPLLTYLINKQIKIFLRNIAKSRTTIKLRLLISVDRFNLRCGAEDLN